MSAYNVVNGTYIVPSTASDQVIRTYFRVLVPTVTKTPITTDEDISAAAYVVQEHWVGKHHSPPLEDWPHTLNLEPDEIDTVLTTEAIQSMKTRIRKPTQNS